MFLQSTVDSFIIIIIIIVIVRIVITDWHELMVSTGHITRPSIASDRPIEQQDSLTVQYADIPPPQSSTLGLHPVAHRLLLISRPAEDRRLSWPEQSTQ